MSSLFQLQGKGLWAVSWYVKGKKKRKTFKDKNKAEAFQQSLLAEAMPENARLTLGELVLRFFQSHPEYSLKTKQNLTTVLAGRDTPAGHKDGHAEFLLNKYADSLTRHDLETMRNNFRNNSSRKVKNVTINKHQAYIRSILEWGVEVEYLTMNPWGSFKQLPVVKKDVKTSLEDVRMAYLCAPDWLKWAIVTMYSLTIRPGKELFRLTWDCFNWHRGCVYVVQAKSGRTKTVYPPVSYMQEAYMRYDADTRAGIPWVCHRKGSRVLDYRTAWDNTVKKAQLAHFPMYHIRHVAISEMLAHTPDIAAVAAQAGHSTPTTTSTFYAHAIGGSQQRVAAMLPMLALPAGEEK